jgi:hypothetical protein
MPEETPEKKLGEYLLQLVMYQSVRTQFEDHLDDALADSGLNKWKQDILRSGDLNSILKELALEYGPKPGDHFVV